MLLGLLHDAILNHVTHSNIHLRSCFPHKPYNVSYSRITSMYACPQQKPCYNVTVNGIWLGDLIVEGDIS